MYDINESGQIHGCLAHLKYRTGHVESVCSRKGLTGKSVSQILQMSFTAVPRS